MTSQKLQKYKSCTEFTEVRQEKSLNLKCSNITDTA